MFDAVTTYLLLCLIGLFAYGQSIKTIIDYLKLLRTNLIYIITFIIKLLTNCHFYLYNK